MDVNIILLLVVIVEGGGFDYCIGAGCKDGIHTMCIYPEPYRFECEGAFKYGLTPEQKKALLDEHNRIRQRVASGGEWPRQPAATNMMKMKWNSEVAKIAQRWANNLSCKYVDRDHCRSTQDGVNCGQNVGRQSYIPTFRGTNYTEMLLIVVEIWYNVSKLVEYSDVKKFSINKYEIADYSQLVWWNTSEIGCGSITIQYGIFYPTIYLVCNYKPGGNIDGAPIYEQGKSCSKCPEGTHCSTRYPGLCTAEENEYEDLGDSAGFTFKPLLFIVTGFQIINVKLSY